MLYFFEHNKFDDDDMILKVTGRYMFIDDSFLRFIASHIEYDAFIKDVGHQGRMEDAFTGCFAMKYKYFIEFLRGLDLQNMEQKSIAIKWLLADYARLHQNMKTCAMNRLGIAYRCSNSHYIQYL